MLKPRLRAGFFIAWIWAGALALRLFVHESRALAKSDQVFLLVKGTMDKGHDPLCRSGFTRSDSFDFSLNANRITMK